MFVVLRNSGHTANASLKTLCVRLLCASIRKLSTLSALYATQSSANFTG